jgi:AAA domain
VSASTLVELCGLPGSGKSTLAALTVAQLQRSGVPACVADVPISAANPRPMRVVRRAEMSGLALAVHPGCAAKSLRSIGASRQGTPRDTIAVTAQWLSLVGLGSRARRTQGVSVLEEGLVQTLWTLSLRAGRDVSGRIWATVPGSAHADLLVVVESPVDVALERLRRRTSRHSRTQHLPVVRQRDELLRGLALLDELVNRSGLHTVRVANDYAAPLAGLAAEIASAVRARHGSVPSSWFPRPA